MNTDSLKYLDCDFYSIEEIDGEKVVHIYGYTYYADSEIEDGKPYRGVEICWFYIPIDLFPDNYKGAYENGFMTCKQYINDLDEEQCAEYIDSYCSNVIELPYDKITPETLCGDYVAYNPDNL